MADSKRGKTTLVFLHYFGGSSRTWSKLIRRLQPYFRCIAPDLPGFGNSAPLTPAYLQQTFSRYLPQTTFTVIPACGHLLSVEADQLLAEHMIKMAILA